MNMPKKVNVCLTCVGGKFMYDFVACLRDLEDVKIHLTGVDVNADTTGQLLCNNFYAVPFVEKEPKLFLEKISEIILKEKIEIFIPSSDEEVALVSENYDHFTKNLGVKVSFGNPATAREATDKYNFMSRLTKSGVNMGKFFLVQSENQLIEALEALGYPEKKVIVKPCKSRGSRGVFLFDSKKENFEPFLENRFCGTGNHQVFLEQIKKRQLQISDMLVMSYYEGSVYDVDMVSKNGKLQDICVRLRQLKNHFSPTSTGHKICMKPQIVQHAQDVCEAVAADGVFDLDIIETDDQILAIDAACRFSGSVGASRVAGHNMPGQLIRSLLGYELQRRPVKDQVILRPFWTMQSIHQQHEETLL